MKYVRRFCVLASLIVALSSSSFAGISWSVVVSPELPSPPSSTSNISPETTVTVVNILVNLLYLS